MSVSVLSSSNPGSLFESASGAGSARMSGQSHLKRPWERDSSPPRSSYTHQHPSAQQLPVSDYGRTNSSMFAHTHGSATSHHAPSLSRHSSQHGHHYGDAHVNMMAPHELHHKRSRLESEPANTMPSPPSGRSRSGPSPAQPGTIHTHLSGYSTGPHDKRYGTSSNSTSPQSVQYHGRISSTGPAPVFPSPSSVTSSTGTSNPSSAQLPPSSSLLSPPASTNTHMQNLQHELNAKSVAYGNLAGEHERLSAAYSRLQSRLTTIDRKSKATEGELMMLQEERITLTERIESLERECEEVRAAKEAEIDQRNRESEQWRRIISLSEAVQKRHTGDSAGWKSEKEGLLKRVESLEGELRRVRLSTGSAASGEVHEALEGSGLTSQSDPDLVAMLRNEIANLRGQSEQARDQLRQYRARIGEVKDMLVKADALADQDKDAPRASN